MKNKAQQQGELKKAQETARNLLACGDSLDKVSKVTGLEKSMVDDIKKHL